MACQSAKKVVFVRLMRRKDAKAVAGMMSDLAAFHGDKALAREEHFIEHCLGAKKLGSAWVATIEGEYSGFAVSYDRMNFVRASAGRTLDLLYVRPEFRGGGVGRALLATVAEDAIAKGITRMSVGALTNNKTANAFYTKAGFEKSTKSSQRYAIEGAILRRLAKKHKT